MKINSFPINFGSSKLNEKESDNFVISEDLQTEYIDRDFRLSMSISILKVIFF